MSFLEVDGFEDNEDNIRKFQEKYAERQQKARQHILKLPTPITYNTPAAKSIYDQAMKSRLIKVPKDELLSTTLAERDYYVVLMGRISYKFLLGKTFKELDDSAVLSTTDLRVELENRNNWHKTYRICIDVATNTFTSIITSNYCQLFSRNVLPEANIGVPIGCDCKDWQNRFVNVESHKLYNFATAGCKHMIAAEEALREYPLTLA